MTKQIIPKLLNIQNAIPPKLFRLKKKRIRPKIYQLDWFILLAILLVLYLIYYLKQKYGDNKQKRVENLNKKLYDIKNY